MTYQVIRVLWKIQQEYLWEIYHSVFDAVGKMPFELWYPQVYNPRLPVYPSAVYCGNEWASNIAKRIRTYLIAVDRRDALMLWSKIFSGSSNSAES
jgi:hypothetical protein